MAIPSDFAGLTGWWKSDAGVYVDAGSTLATDGQSVQQWNDQSGNGRHFSQATVGYRPLYQTNEVNGLPLIQHDGSDDSMDNGFMSNFISVSTGTIYAAAYVVAVTRGDWQQCDVVWSDFVSNGRTCLGMQSTGSGTVPRSYAVSYSGGGGLSQANINGSPTGRWHVFFWMHSGGTIYHGRSDVRTASLASVAAGDSDPLGAAFQLGKNGWSVGRQCTQVNIGEVFTYNTAHNTEADRMALETYLANRYGISIPYLGGAFVVIQ